MAAGSGGGMLAWGFDGAPLALCALASPSSGHLDCPAAMVAHIQVLQEAQRQIQGAKGPGLLVGLRDGGTTLVTGVLQLRGGGPAQHQG